MQNSFFFTIITLNLLKDITRTTDIFGIEIDHWSVSINSFISKMVKSLTIRITYGDDLELNPFLILSLLLFVRKLLNTFTNKIILNPKLF